MVAAAVRESRVRNVDFYFRLSVSPDDETKDHRARRPVRAGFMAGNGLLRICSSNKPFRFVGA
jgi:hypothetical protein